MTASRTPRFCLLVVAKAPVPGLAKTRLTPPATPRQAAEIAAAALLDTLSAVLDTPGAVPVVALTGNLGESAGFAQLREMLSSFEVFSQQGKDFAHRLANAHAEVAARHPGLPVVQIGMDTPQVTPELLGDTAGLLAEANSVLGPAEDGGWWALGLRDPHRASALAEVPMSRTDTATRTLAALARNGDRPRLTTQLCDVDTMSDARQVASAAPGGRFADAVVAVGVTTGVIAFGPKGTPDRMDGRFTTIGKVRS